MTFPVLVVSDDKAAAEQFVSKHPSQKLSFMTVCETEKVCGVLIVAAGKDFLQLRLEYLRLFQDLRKFPIALVAINQEKALKANSYEYVENHDFVYPLTSLIGLIGFNEGSGQRRLKACAEGEFVAFLEANCEDFPTIKPERFGREEVKVAKEFQKHGKWGWLPRQ